MKLKVFACDGLDTEAAKKIEEFSGIELQVASGIAAADVVSKLGDVQVAIIRSATQLQHQTLEQLPNLKGVIRAGVGLDNIDVSAAERLGIYVWNSPNGNYQSTAELALSHLFNVARKITYATEGARSGKWLKKEIGATGRQLCGLTLGIYGVGNIGSRLAAMAQGIGMKILVCDPVYTGQVFKKVEFDELLKESDAISIHAPLLESTRHVFNEVAFNRMKPGSILVNCARGGIIDERALLKALQESIIGGAGLDVFEREPFDVNDPVTAALLKDPRVSSTPHIGAATREAQRLVGIETAEKVIAISMALEKRNIDLLPKPLNHPKSPRFLS